MLAASSDSLCANDQPRQAPHRQTQALQAFANAPDLRGVADTAALTRWRIGIGALAKVCDHAAYRQVGDGVGDERASVEDLAALQAAVLRSHDEFLPPVQDRRSLRVMDRLQRLHLSWLAIPWILVDAVRMFMVGHPRRMFAGHQQTVHLYRQLSGEEPYLARAEVWRIIEQLGMLDERVHRLGSDRPGAPRGADRAELEAAAAALIGYYLAGRRTEDQLLRGVQAAWAECEELHEQQLQRDLERGRRGRRRDLAEAEPRLQAATDRYLVAWRRWFDQQAHQGTSAGSSDR
jgi:hypothetical protein